MAAVSSRPCNNTRLYLRKKLKSPRFRSMLHFLDRSSNIAQMRGELERAEDYEYALALLCVMVHQHMTQLGKLRKYTATPSARLQKCHCIIAHLLGLDLAVHPEPSCLVEAVEAELFPA
jgi:hypothetical protein